MVMGWFWACGFSVVFWGPFWEAVWSCAAALSFPARRTCLNAEAICTGITRRKKIRIRAPATRHWPRSMRDPNPFACHPPPRAALDCRILARGDCGPAKLAVGSLTLHTTLYTRHSSLFTPYFTLYTPHFSLHTLHSTLHTLHSTLYTLHSTLYTLHYTFHSTLHTLHFTIDISVIFFGFLLPFSCRSSTLLRFSLRNRP